MIVADTSAWVEYLRRTESPVDLTLDRIIGDDEDLRLTEVVVMEVLAGARSPRHERELRLRLAPFPVIPLRGTASYDAAAATWRACRRGGRTVRNLLDCLVAQAAMEAGAAVLHDDRDFDVIAAHVPLRIHPLDPDAVDGP